MILKRVSASDGSMPFGGCFFAWGDMVETEGIEERKKKRSSRRRGKENAKGLFILGKYCIMKV